MTAKVVMGFATDEIPASRTEYDAYYRWWPMRFNHLDVDIPGRDFQFPVSIEGVTGYDNAIALTRPMHIDDLKHLRDPVYSCGPWLSVGQTSKGGRPAIAGNLARYAEGDARGQLSHYDTNGNGVIEYDWGALTGNDAAVSFDWRPGRLDRAGAAYVWSGAAAGHPGRWPDANEFWANWNASTRTVDYRSWIHHNTLGSSNRTVVEDVAGLRPRTDAAVGLWPIDIGWSHFAVNDLRYRGVDLSVVWDDPADGVARYQGVPEGYSAYLGGTRAFTVDRLTRGPYDPATGAVTFPSGSGSVRFSAPFPVLRAPQDLAHTGARLVDVFAKAGVNLASSAPNLARGARQLQPGHLHPGHDPAAARRAHPRAGVPDRADGGEGLLTDRTRPVPRSTEDRAGRGTGGRPGADPRSSGD
ncbi:hypothetical protein ACFV4N_37365 [Actinosynnema sp. NPDC059797]